MLDVHAPHEPMHTWRGFFIHMAAIVVGLLIAISLEQMVEFLHHREQRRQLLEDLRREAEERVHTRVQSVAMKSADLPTAKGEPGMGVSSPVAAFNSKPVTVPALPFRTYRNWFVISMLRESALAPTATGKPGSGLSAPVC